MGKGKLDIDRRKKNMPIMPYWGIKILANPLWMTLEDFIQKKKKVSLLDLHFRKNAL